MNQLSYNEIFFSIIMYKTHFNEKSKKGEKSTSEKRDINHDLRRLNRREKKIKNINREMNKSEKKVRKRIEKKRQRKREKTPANFLLTHVKTKPTKNTLILTIYNLIEK